MKEKAKSKEIKIVNPVRKCVTGMILAVILSLIVWSIMLVINIMSTQEASNFVSYMLNSFGAENNQVTDLRYEGIFRKCVRETVNHIAGQVIEILAVLSVRTHDHNVDVISCLHTQEFSFVVDVFFYVIQLLSAVNDLHIVIWPFDLAVEQSIFSASVRRRGNIVKHSLAVQPHFRKVADSRSHPVAEPDFAVLYFDNSAISQLADRGVSQF